jgi:hypothetical protein
MTSALRLYRATVLSTADPQGQGRVHLSLVRTVRGVLVRDEGWAKTGASPLGISAEVQPLYAAGDVVIYAAQRLPFVGAVVLFREVNSLASAGGQALSLHIALGQGNEVTIETAASGLRLSTTAGQQVNVLVNGTIEVMSTELSLSAASKLAVTAGQVTVDAGMVKVSGVIKCDTLIANSVVATSYTPGAGNLQ